MTRGFMMSQTSQSARNVKNTLTIIFTTRGRASDAKINKWGQQVSKQFRVTYETKGVKVVNVWLPKGVEIPAQWGSMTLREQDEWLYENQSEAHLNWSDETEGEVVNILPVAELKAVSQ